MRHDMRLQHAGKITAILASQMRCRVGDQLFVFSKKGTIP